MSNTLPIILTSAWLVVAAALFAFVPALRRSAAVLSRRPAFLTAVVVLAVAALSLNGAVGALELHFRKLPVPLAVKALSDPTEGIPSHLGPWVQVSHDEGIDGETEQVLGTRQYVFRDYVDTRVWPQADVEAMVDKAPREREAELAHMQASKPDSVIRAAVTYYTGMADTVAHIPERCYVADGYEPSASQLRSASMGVASDGRAREVAYRFITFEDQTGRGRVGRNVAYLFHVDGQYESDSLAVRRRLQSLSERYGYYAKLELMTSRPGGGGDAASEGAARQQSDVAAHQTTTVATMDDFLGFILPELERCLPNWNALHQSGGGGGDGPGARAK